MICCSAHDCNNPLYAKGFCCAHYKRLYKHGTLDKLPLGDKSKHPLYKMWATRRQLKNSFITEWKLDFYKFLKDVGKQPEKTYLSKIKKNELCGPGNFEWKPLFIALANETDKDRLKRQRKEKVIKDPNFYRLNNYKYVYKISIEQYEEMMKTQNGLCYICEGKETTKYKGTENIRNLSVDHCHTTGKIRGLLCSRCNLILGRVYDNVLLLEKMIFYLKKFS